MESIPWVRCASDNVSLEKFNQLINGYCHVHCIASLKHCIVKKNRHRTPLFLTGKWLIAWRNGSTQCRDDSSTHLDSRSILWLKIILESLPPFSVCIPPNPIYNGGAYMEENLPDWDLTWKKEDHTMKSVTLTSHLLIQIKVNFLTLQSEKNEQLLCKYICR